MDRFGKILTTFLLGGGMIWLVIAGVVNATDILQCKADSNCVIGEFLYDDDYQPINTGATCTVTSRNPDGTMLLNGVGVSTPTGSDGWYSYNLNTSGKTEGVYPTSLCCSIGTGTTEFVCQEKTFKISSVWNESIVGFTNPGTFGYNLQTTSPSTAAIWNYSGRTLTDFGSLISSIWSYSDRSLTSFGSLVANVWGYATRTLTHATLNSGQLAVQSDVTSSTATIQGEIVGTQTSMASGIAEIRSDILGVQTSLAAATAAIRGDLSALDTKVSNIGTSLSNISSNWGSYTAADIVNQLSSLTGIVGGSGDTCSNTTVFGTVACVRDKWGSENASGIMTKVNDTYDKLTNLQSEIDFNGKSTTAYAEIQAIRSSLSTIDSAIGSARGEIAGVQTTVDSISTKIDNLDTRVAGVGNTVSQIVNKWGSYSATDIVNLISPIASGVGSSGDSCSSSTIFGGIQCVRDKWGDKTATSLYNQAAAIATTVDSLRGEINYNGKSTTAYEDFQDIKSRLGIIDDIIGTSGDTAVTATLFGRINASREDIALIDGKVDALDAKISVGNTGISSLISKWDGYSAGEIISSLNNVRVGLGSSGDSCSSSTIFGGVSCLKDKWGSDTASGIYTAAEGARQIILELQSELNYHGKSTTAYADIQSLLTAYSNLDTAVGYVRSDISGAVASIKGSSNKDLTQVSGQIAGVQTVVDSISTKVDNLVTDATTIKSNLTSLLAKWSTYTVADVLNQLTTVSNSVGSEGDICDSNLTIFGHINCLENNTATADNTAITTALSTISSNLTSLINEVDYSGKSTTAYSDLQALKGNVTSLLTAIGSTSDTSASSTIFGKLKGIQTTVDVLEGAQTGVDTTIDKWGDLSAADIYDKVKDLAAKIDSVNTVTNVASILTVSQSSETKVDDLKNQLLAIKALSEVNKDLLERTNNRPVIKTWLEEGSIIFKTMITNPATIRQLVPLKYFLPKEVKREDIIKVDSGLTVGYDTKEEAFYVSGEFDLKPKETRIMAIEVTDIWKFEDSEIETIKKQNEELSKVLKGTAYNAQGIVLSSNISVVLDNIRRTQEKAITPEAKISSYRQNIDEMKQVKTQIKELQGLVGQVSGAGTLMGFVGGAQAVSMWGIVIILLGGIVFLGIYIKLAIEQLEEKTGKKIAPRLSKRTKRIAGLAMVAIIAGGLTSWATLSRTAKKASKIVLDQPKLTLVQEVQEPSGIATVLGETVAKIKVRVPQGAGSIKIRQAPSEEATIVGKIWSEQTVNKYNQVDGWTEIDFGDKTKNVRGWIKDICIVTEE